MDEKQLKALKPGSKVLVKLAGLIGEYEITIESDEHLKTLVRQHGAGNIRLPVNE